MKVKEKEKVRERRGEANEQWRLNQETGVDSNARHGLSIHSGDQAFHFAVDGGDTQFWVQFNVKG